MQKYNGALLRKFDDDIEGNASVGTSVVVRKKSDNNIAAIYDVDDTNSIQKPNPFVTDAFGRYSFFAPNGKYVLEFGDGSDSIEITLVDNIVHNELLGRGDVGAHDDIYSRHVDTVIEVADLGLSDGAYIFIDERKAKFRVKTGTPNGYDKVDAGNGLVAELALNGCVFLEWIGAKLDGVFDNADHIDHALTLDVKTVYVGYGDCFSSRGFIKPQGVNLIGFGGMIGAQLAGQLPATTITIDGPTSGWAVEVPVSPDQEDGAAIKGIYFRAVGASSDAVGGIWARAKNTVIEENGFLNFTIGVKGNNTEVYILKNQINSCGICIDDSGGESHIVDNHGYPETTAILLRLSASTVRGNKFYGDGAAAATGIEVRGSGNNIIGGVLDAFTDRAIIFKPVAGTDCDNNSVVGVNVSGTGVNGQPYQTPFVFDASAANVRNNTITGCPVFNKRGDRVTKYLASFVGVGAFDCSDNQLNDNAVDRSSLTVGVVQSSGANAKRNSVGRNSGLITKKVFTQSVVNGETVTVSDLDLPIASIGIVAGSNNVGAFGYDSKTGTSFRVLLRDVAGALITTPVAVNFTVDCVSV